MIHTLHDNGPTPHFNPWSNGESLGVEFEATAQPVNYAELIGENSVLMLGECHTNDAIREHIATHAADLKQAGITHYAIEAPWDPIFNRLNSGECVDLSYTNVGPSLGSTNSHERAVHAMANQGIIIVPIDIDQTTRPSNQTRETFLADALKQVLVEDPTAKIAVLIGAMHAMKSESKYSDTTPSMARLLANDEVAVSTIIYIGGSEMGTNAASAAARVYKDQSEFMIDLRPYEGMDNVVYGSGNADYAVHLPQRAGAGSSSWEKYGFSRSRKTEPIPGSHLKGATAIEYYFPVEFEPIDYARRLGETGIRLKHVKIELANLPTFKE